MRVGGSERNRKVLRNKLKAMKTSQNLDAISYESVQNDLGMTGAIVLPIMERKSPEQV